MRRWLEFPGAKMPFQWLRRFASSGWPNFERCWWEFCARRLAVQHYWEKEAHQLKFKGLGLGSTRFYRTFSFILELRELVGD